MFPLEIINNAVGWPAKAELFGVQVSIATYDQIVDCALNAVQQRTPKVIFDFMPVNLLVAGAMNLAFRSRLNTFSIVAPDGQPVRWALNWFHQAGLQDRVYGPESMLRICAAAAEKGVRIYLYGGAPQVLEKLCGRLKSSFPALKIAGAESPPFRPLTADEDSALVQRIENSGAEILFIGLGGPRQENFAYEHRDRIAAVQMCVGAAFDFHAGHKPMAPRWMQKRGLEWLFRLCQEPRRLGKRYLVTNTLFIFLCGRKMIMGK